MPIHLRKRCFAVVLSALLLPTVVVAQQAGETLQISAIRQKTLDLYEAADLNAPRTTITVPEGALGSDWRVLESSKQFYKIQAGTQGTGWARRSFITVVRNGGMVVPCINTASIPSEPMATTAGAGRRPC